MKFEKALYKYNGTDKTHIEVPNDFVCIGARAFADHSEIETITIPETVTFIEDEAFIKCTHLRHIEGGKGIQRIGKRTYSGCLSLVWENLPLNLKTIGANAFNGCISLQKIALPEKMEMIGDEAFQGCRNLTSAILPFDVGSFGKYVFTGCSNLYDVLTNPQLVKDNPTAFPYEVLCIYECAETADIPIIRKPIENDDQQTSAVSPLGAFNPFSD